MKYALISEEQIEKIRTAVDFNLLADNHKARLILQSLKPSDPVAWIGDKPFSITRYETVAVRAGFSTPLYALTGETK